MEFSCLSTNVDANCDAYDYDEDDCAQYPDRCSLENIDEFRRSSSIDDRAVKGFVFDDDQDSHLISVDHKKTSIKLDGINRSNLHDHVCNERTNVKILPTRRMHTELKIERMKIIE